MLNATMSFTAVALMLVGLLNTASAAVGYRRLDAIVDEADAIAVAVVGGARTTDGGTEVAVQVLDSLKGSISGLVESRYGSSIAASPALELTGKRILVFLSAPESTGRRPIYPIADGSVSLTDLLVELPETSSASMPPRTSEDTTLAKVIKELGGAAAGSPSSPAWRYLLNLTWGSDAERKVLHDVFQAMNSASGQVTSDQGTIGLLYLGRTDGLLALEKAFLRQPGNFREDGGLTDVLGASYRDPSREGAAILENMLAPERPRALRVAAGRALARVHTAHMIAILARLLNDSDVELQSIAVGGLSMFTNDLPIGSPQPRERDWPFRTDDTMQWSVNDFTVFREREAEYLTFWHSWWASNEGKVRAIAGLEEKDQ